MLFVSGVSSWQRAQVSANWRHSMSGAQRNDKEKRPNKTLIHCADLKSPLPFTNQGPSFCKLFRRRSPAKLPVQLRRGYRHHSCKLWHPCTLFLCIQNQGGRSRQSYLWPCYFPVPKGNWCKTPGCTQLSCWRSALSQALASAMGWAAAAKWVSEARFGELENSTNLIQTDR